MVSGELMFTQVHIHTTFPRSHTPPFPGPGYAALAVVAHIITDRQVPHELFIITARKLQFDI